METQRMVTGASPAAPGMMQAAPRMTLVDTSQWNDTVGGSIDSVRTEVDDAFADMKTFHNLNPDECMRLAGGHSARLSELRVRIFRIEDRLREWKSVRTNEIEPALEELERQWRNSSRLQSVRELDYKMESGER